MRIRRNPKIVALGPGAAYAAAGVSENPALMEDIQIAVGSAPELLSRYGINPDELPRMQIGQGHYARVFGLPNGLVLKLTTDRDDAEAAALIKDAGSVPGLINVAEVWRLQDQVPAVEFDFGGDRGPDSWRRLPYRESLYAIVTEMVRPVREWDYDADVARQMLGSLVDAYTYNVPSVVDQYLSTQELIDAELPVWADEELSPKALRYFTDILNGWKWLSERGYDVEDIHSGNFGIGSPDRMVMFDFGHMSGGRATEMPQIPLAANRGAKVDRVFDESFDAVERRFPDIGTVELYEDERAGQDNGAGSERQYAYCKEGDPIIIAFAPKAHRAPLDRLRGLMRHEFGHALEYRYGVKELEKRLGKLPAEVERRADVIAERVFGEPIVYDEKLVQCVGREGIRPRPAHLPDEKAKLKANPRAEAPLPYPSSGQEEYTLYITDGRKRRGIERALDEAGIIYSYTSRAEHLRGETDPHFRRYAKATLDFNATPAEAERLSERLAFLDGWSWDF